MKYLLLLVFTSFLTGCLETCENTVVSKELNKENGLLAVVFDRNCGATTSLSRQVSLLKNGKELSNEAGNIFTSTHFDDIEVNWIDSRHLEVIRSGRGKDFLMEESFEDITIIYKLNDSEQVSGGNG